MSRENLLRYIWETQILPQAGYSFSRLHAVGYSLIALQEMNLAHYYPQVYWNTACLSVNAGADEDNEDNKGTNYGRIATALGNMIKRGIKIVPPDINKSGFGFKPNAKENAIIFGLKSINGINDDVSHSIINNRPYNSFKDFLVRMYDSKIVKNGQMMQLIKGGCFDSFGERKEIMKQFIYHTFEPKQKLNMQNMPMLVNNGLLPDEFHLECRFFNYKNYISKSVFEVIKKPKDRLFKLDEVAQPFFEKHFTEECVIKMSDDGYLVISEKKFKKEYDKKMESLKEWLSKDETVAYINDLIFNELWIDYEEESVSKWEMDALSYYYHDHELSHVNKDKYDISNFSALSDQPVVTNEYEYRGRQMKEYQLTRIAGTVLDKDKNKHNVTLLTTDGVVTLKLYAGQFGFYNQQLSQKNSDGKKEVIEKSWFTRGNLILATGFRRGNQFVVKKYKNSVYQHALALIQGIDDQGNLSLQTERAEI